MNALARFAESPLADALGWSLLHFLWQGALIAILAWIPLRAAKSARMRYAAACAALAAMPIVFGATLWISIPSEPAATASAGAGSFHSPAIPPVPPAASAARNLGTYLDGIACAWIVGVACVVLYRAAAWIFAMRLRRRGTCAAPREWIERLKTLAPTIGVSRPVLLVESALAEIPVMIGYLRPAILVPVGMLAGLPPDQVEAVLLHELAHIRRADYLVSLMQSAIEALLFYHPAVWWISGVIRAERENCCDDMVLAANADPLVYASALVSVERNRGALAPALAATDGDLVRRVRRVLREPEKRPSSLPLIPAAMALVAVAVGFAQTQSHTAAMPPVYQKWLDEDVVYIITGAERKQFQSLSTDAARDRFIEDFWLRRDPTPGTPENEFKEEHYRRIAFANNRFKSPTLPGWKTDRGMIYIKYGPPDEIESHPSGGAYQRPAEGGGGTVVTVPFEQWRYKLIEGVGTNIIIEFVDPQRNGEYRMTTDPHAKEEVKAAAPSGLKIRATVSAPGKVTVSIPLDYAGDVAVSARATNSAGFAAAWFDQSVPKPARTTLVREMNLAPGWYTILVTVKEMKTGATNSDTASVEVK